MIFKEIDSSALGDSKSQGMLECTGVQPWVDLFSLLAAQKESSLADWTAFSGCDSRKVNGRTGQNMCPMEKLWWGESDLHSPLA